MQSSIPILSLCALGMALIAGNTSNVQAAGSPDQPAEQTIVFLRHGEKPAGGLGQLNCQGLNRALALPKVMAEKFGKPDKIFAPNPSERKDDDGTDYDYIRPLATIEPTAIAFGMPVDTSIGYDDVRSLVKTLNRSAKQGGVVFVAWEHKKIVKAVKALMDAGDGNSDDIPKWKGEDFDSLYVIRRSVSDKKVTFEHLQEGLDGLSQTCPSPVSR